MLSLARGRKKHVQPVFWLMLAVLAAPTTLYAGTLSLGQPSVEGSQYVFPVALGGADAQVSALDFRLQFDPRVFVPVSVAPGPAALAANKMVSANNSAPGLYVVVMMGLNQSTIPGGIVASVQFQRIGDGDGAAATTVGIADLTLAGPDGNELPASGSSVSVPLRESTQEEKAEGEDDPDATPETPAPDAESPGKDAEAPVPNAKDVPTHRMLAGAPADNVEVPTPAVSAPANAPAPDSPEADGVSTGSATAPAASVSSQEVPGAPASPGMSTTLPLPRGGAASDTTVPSASSQIAGVAKSEAPAAKTKIMIGGQDTASSPGDQSEAGESADSHGISAVFLPLLGLGALALAGFLGWRRVRPRR